MPSGVGSDRMLRLAALALFLGAGGCGDDEAPTTPDVATGHLAVTSGTTGEQLDSNGYEIWINDSFVRALGIDDSTLISGVRADDMRVELAEVESNCTVQGDNPRTVPVPEDDTTATAFLVHCIATSGTIEVVTTTTGEDLDSDYVVSIDGGAQGVVAATDTFRSSSLPSGEHTVSLGDVALNCLLAGDPERVVTVPIEGPALTAYEIFCTDEVGTLRIVTSTSGTSPDPDGYEVVIESAAPFAVAANDTLDVAGVAAGQVRVTLLEASVAPGCQVTGSNPRNVAIAQGEVSDTAFEVACDGT